MFNSVHEIFSEKFSNKEIIFVLTKYPFEPEHVPDLVSSLYECPG